MAEPHEARGVGPNNIQKRVLGGLGKPGACAGLGEGLLVKEPDADVGVLVVGAGGVTRRLGGVELPDEARPSGADLVEEVVVLERPGAGHLLDCGLDGLLDHGSGLG